jgi:hypothetical protein
LLTTEDSIPQEEEPQTLELIDSKEDNLYWETEDVNPNLVIYDLENNKTDNASVIGKMDDVFTKLGDLEQKLAQMDAVMAKIDELGAKVEASKPKTGVEKLEMRSLDSYPFNEKPQEFFAHKQGEMAASGKNEYVLTKDEVNNYPTDIIKTSFNPDQQEDEFKF